MHEQHNNSLFPRTVGAIALCPTGNEQGSYYLLSLHTGKRFIQLFCSVWKLYAKSADSEIA